MLKISLTRRFAQINFTFGVAYACLLFSNPPIVTAETADSEKTNNETAPAAIGQVAPSLVVVDAGGQKRMLAQLRGKKALLLTFFPKCFTGNCTSQLQSLRDTYPALQKAGVEVWGVSTDVAGGVRGQRAFAKHLKLPFPLIPDADRKVSLLFGAVLTREQMAARMSVFIDKSGVVRWVDKQMDVRTHGPDVLAHVRTQR